MEKFSFLPGEREHRHKREDNDRHREKGWTANQLCGRHDGFKDKSSVVRIDALQMSERIFGDDNARIHKHSNGDGNARKRHHIRGHMRIMHQQEGAEYGKRQRYGDDQNAAEVHQENDMRECDQDDLFDQRMTECIDRGLDQLRAVIERNDVNTGRQTWFDLLDFLFYAVDDFFRVLARSCHDDTANRLGAVLN